MATNTPARVRVTEIPPMDEDSREALRDGLRAAAFFASSPIDRLYDDMPAKFTEPVCVDAWETFQDEALEEVLDQVADLMAAALRRRLPFEWEGPELYR